MPDSNTHANSSSPPTDNEPPDETHTTSRGVQGSDAPTQHVPIEDAQLRTDGSGTPDTKAGRQFQNGFEPYNNSLSAISTFKGVNRRTHVLDYEDLGDTLQSTDGGREDGVWHVVCHDCTRWEGLYEDEDIAEAIVNGHSEIGHDAEYAEVDA